MSLVSSVKKKQPTKPQRKIKLKNIENDFIVLFFDSGLTTHDSVLIRRIHAIDISYR